MPARGDRAELLRRRHRPGPCDTAAPAVLISGDDVNAVTAAGVFGNLRKLRDALRPTTRPASPPPPRDLKADYDRVVQRPRRDRRAVQELETAAEPPRRPEHGDQVRCSRTSKDTDFTRGDHAVPDAADGAAGEHADDGESAEPVAAGFPRASGTARCSCKRASRL